MTKEKNFGDNEAPVFRWLLALVFGLVVGGLIGSVMSLSASMIPAFGEGGVLACERELVAAITTFAGLYIGLLLGLRWFCRTSMRTFIIGKGRKPDAGVLAKTGGLFILGLLISDLHSIKDISLNKQSVSVILFNFVFCLLFLWMQTTTEEIVFRGMFLRIPYANKLPILPKGLFFAVISSLLFMAMHMANPEMLHLSGAEVIAGAGSYFLAGFFLYISDLLIGGMEVGVLLHFLNNFYCMAFLSEAVSAVETSTIFVKSATEHSGMWALISELIAFCLPLIYLYIHRRRSEQ